MMNTKYQIASRSDAAAFTVITIHERVDLGHRDGVDTWTLVSSADGHDVLIDPDGRHINPNTLHLPCGWVPAARVTDLVEWLVEAL